MRPIILKRKKRTGISFLLSLCVHVIILVLIIASVGYVYQQGKAHANLQVKKQQLKPIVQAVAVNQQQIETEISTIKARRQARHNKAVAWQQHLEQMAKQATENRQVAEKQLVQLKQKTNQEQKLAKKQLKRLRLLQQQATARLKNLQHEQKQLTTQNLTVSKQLAITKKALQQQQTAAKKLALQNQLAQEKTQQKIIAQQQLVNQVARYKTLILNNIGQQWIIPQGVNPNLSCQLLVTLASNGDVENVKLLKSSGNPVLDRSAITAVLKASPLPVPKDPEMFKQFAQLKLMVKPEGLLGG